MYAIRNLCHRTDIDMGRHGFSIDLSPEWKDAVAKSGLDHEKIASFVDCYGREWLDAAGFDAIFDPDNCGAFQDKTKPPGTNARPLYEPRTSLRCQLGDWGLEHITVPGNACGLDIERNSFGSVFRGGVRLLPHNVDSLSQKYLLLMIFTEFAETVFLFSGNR